MSLHHFYIEDQSHEFLNLIWKWRIFSEKLIDIEIFPFLIMIVTHLYNSVPSIFDFALSFSVVLPYRRFSLKNATLGHLADYPHTTPPAKKVELLRVVFGN